MKLLIVDDAGTVVETIDLDGMNLAKPLAQAEVMREIRAAVARAAPVGPAQEEA